MPIRLKLSLWYSGVSLLIMTLFCTYLYLFFTHREMGQIDQHLSERGKEVHQSIKIIDAFPLPMQRLVLPDIDVFSTAEVFLQIVNPQGLILSRSDSLGEYTLPISKQALSQMAKKEVYFETKEVQNTLVRIYYLPLHADNQFVGILQVAESLYSFQRSLETLRWLLALGALSITTISALIGWFLSKKALQPIHRIIETTASIEQNGALNQRINYAGPNDEIGRLSTQINQMLEKVEDMYNVLQESYEAQRRFVADASHELRTPLTSIRGNMDYLRKLYLEKGVFSIEATDDIIEELERVSRMVHYLLALARADAGYKVQMDDFELKSLAEDVIDQTQRLASYSVTFYHEPTDLLDSLKLKGNRDFLRQVFLILLENAFKYTPNGQVSLLFRSEPESIKFIVQDTGIGISEEDLVHLFDRFYRGSNVRQIQGTGLGLSIAKWIIDKHNGSIAIQSKLGQGTRIEVTLPLE